MLVSVGLRRLFFLLEPSTKKRVSKVYSHVVELKSEHSRIRFLGEYRWV